MTINRQSLLQAIKFVSQACDKSGARPILEGIRIEFLDIKGREHIRLTATDTFGINQTEVVVSEMNGSEPFEPFVVKPFKVEPKGDIYVELFIDDFGDVVYKDGDNTQILEVVDGVFPNLDSFLTVDADTEFLLNPKRLAEMTKYMYAVKGGLAAKFVIPKPTKLSDGTSAVQRPILIKNLGYERAAIMPCRNK